MASKSLIEQAKQACAYAAVDNELKSDAKVVGIGSGTTVVYVVERISQRTDLKDTIYIPTGFQSKQLILQYGLRVGNIDEISSIDITFDGADEIEPSLNCIKGGGACLFQEKLIASMSKRFILVADDRKDSEILGSRWKQGVPIEVSPYAYLKVINDLIALGCQNPLLRMGAPAKAGPAVTDNGFFIIDADFGIIKDVVKLEAQIKALVGVLDVGLFPGMAEKAYLGMSDGTTKTLLRAI
ncbi:hypothetical protein CANCADRAFT_30465 [Tortispora caseinolytica NRRL Y-17796]|uniref:Ribose-5-phosphate isomerase n=1 Tax=Tortispora caseinolytica NRRL Y-17796 TaxID=767744 RepID=A0A1E4TKH8_9ASCO|nr:hypothetical protein CANCADRAFT_30465 [Tortispora caseinolytica NRRL Y-17796]